MNNNLIMVLFFLLTATGALMSIIGIIKFVELAKTRDDFRKMVKSALVNAGCIVFIAAFWVVFFMMATGKI